MRRPAPARRLVRAARELDSHRGLIDLSQRLRRRLPGDPDFGDPLSTAGREQAQVLGRRLAEITGERPGVLREAGLSALQVWESVSEAQGRGRGDRPLAIVFTDLVAFSDWALDAGDDAAIELLREVGRVLEPAITAEGGEVVKRLGDGLMAVFEDPGAAVAGVRNACERLGGIEVAGYRPQLRSGIHWGRPRRLGGDYLGVDVNVAARLAQEARAQEILISAALKERLGEVEAKRRRRFRVKGVPRDVEPYSLQAPA
jgi:adenylate cyclase